MRGPSGAGKSDLALRLIRRGAGLVADDAIEIRHDNGCLFASAPASIAGMLEVRGIGIVRLPHVATSRVGAVIDLVAAHLVERLPEDAVCEWLGVGVPRYALAAFEASAVDKVRVAAELAAGRLSTVA